MFVFGYYCDNFVKVWFLNCFLVDVDIRFCEVLYLSFDIFCFVIDCGISF